ncbi:hypothetical protein [Bordetella genomosp. 11]|uniref:Lipoprotein n=1 Tax=Bordetella genomosp. 11 TaxID=1416808 RepID=A0A261UJS9_9BORD|nr:hypothetical protein [Bordetella genomosp. 11]OZI61143.1 hypothetical protein CAL28_17525 [Bordetella genomosp. 11]
MRLNSILFSMGLIALILTTACTWKHAYDVAQGRRQFQCVQITDMQDRQRCMEESTMSYDAYENERRKLRP